MRALSSARVLDVWERGAALSPAARAGALLAAAEGEPEEAAALMSIPRRDGALVELRTLLFGETMAATVDCPACGEVLDVTLDAVSPEPPPEQMDVAVDGYEVAFRLPASADVEAAAAAGADVRAVLFHRCIATARVHGEETPVAGLPTHVLDAVEDAMSRADDGTTVELSCAACGHDWVEPLDVGTFLWEEVAALARRVAADVHVLASAYGWAEADILALSPTRRRLYVEVVSN